MMSTATRSFFLVSLAALVCASGLYLLIVTGHLAAWNAMVHLMLLGWITGMILAVSYHTMPVFAAREFPYPSLIYAHLAIFVSGILFATTGLLFGSESSALTGFLMQLLASLLFVANSALLFLRGPRRAISPSVPALQQQEQVDRIGTQATKIAPLTLSVGLALLTLSRLGWISASWWLAAEHLLALGWVTLMIVGVAFHVLPRFSGQALRGASWARAQLVVHTVSVLLIVPALGFGWSQAFVVGGVLMGVALALFAWTIWPTVRAVRAEPPVVSTGQLRESHP